MPRQNSSFPMFVFLIIVFILLKKIIVCKKNNHCVYDKKYTRNINESNTDLKAKEKELEKILKKDKALKKALEREKEINEFMKMGEWNTIIPDSEIVSFEKKNKWEVEKKIQERMPLNTDPHWINFLIHN
jgi:hypothetical protein